MNRKMALVTIIMLGLFAAPVMAQGDIGDIGSWLPEDITGYLGIAIISAFLAWWLGGGMSYIQVAINNIAIKLGWLVPAWLNTALAFVFALVVTAGLLALNLIPEETLAGFEPQYDLIRGFVLLVLAYGGNQAKYYAETRGIQAERKATIAS